MLILPIAIPAVAGIIALVAGGKVRWIASMAAVIASGLQVAVAAPAPQLAAHGLPHGQHLPESVAGGYEAPGEVEIARGRGADVRHAEAVGDDAHGLLESGKRER